MSLTARPTRIRPNKMDRPITMLMKNMMAATELESVLMFETAYEMPMMATTAPTIFIIGVMLSDNEPDMSDVFLKMNASKIMIGTPIKRKFM
jgi:hypothetical protein